MLPIHRQFILYLASLTNFVLGINNILLNFILAMYYYIEETYLQWF